MDANDNVYVFNRGEHPVIVLDRSGAVINSWGEGIFTSAHGAAIGPDESLYCIDAADHTVRKFTLDGQLLMTLGEKGRGSGRLSGKPFSNPTHAAVDPNTGDIYVSDGYSNAVVHKYLAGRQAAAFVGTVGYRPGRVQHRAQHRDRRRGQRLRRRPREPASPDIRLVGRLPGAVERPRNGVLHHHRRWKRTCLRRRNVRGHSPEPDGLGKLDGQATWPACDRVRFGWERDCASRRRAEGTRAPDSSSRRTASPSTRTATSTSPRSRTPHTVHASTRRARSGRCKSWSVRNSVGPGAFTQGIIYKSNTGISSISRLLIKPSLNLLQPVV